MESAFGIEHGYPISKASSYERRRADNTFAGGALGGLAGGSVGSVLAAEASLKHDDHKYWKEQAERNTQGGKDYAWKARKTFERGQTMARYPQTRSDEYQGRHEMARAGTHFENAHHEFERGRKYASWAKEAKASRNKLTAGAVGAVVGGTAIGAAAGHYGTKKPQKRKKKL